MRRELSDEEEKSLLEKYYHQHQAKIEKMVKEALEDNSIAVIVDCHSFPSEPFPYEKPSKFKRPNICIGADTYHTPLWLRDLTDLPSLRVHTSHHPHRSQAAVEHTYETP